MDQDRGIEVQIDQWRWTCTLADYRCAKSERSSAEPPPGALRGVSGPVRGPHVATSDEPRRSPDGAYEAVIQNYNLAVRKVGAKTLTVLSTDGSEGNAYTLASLQWSPDSQKIAVYRRRPGYQRMVNYVQPSPTDQLQPKLVSRFYRKPGDVVDVDQPVLFDVATRKIPLAIYIGTRDQFYPIQVVRGVSEALKKLDFPLVYREMPDHDHNYKLVAPDINPEIWKYFSDNPLPHDPRYTSYRDP